MVSNVYKKNKDVPNQFLFFSTGKGLEVSGTFSRKNSVVYMDMTFSNKAMQPLSNFGIQFNKNSFGVAPAQPLNVPAISPNQSVDVSLPLNTSGPVQKMDPLTNLQVKNFLQPLVLPIPWKSASVATLAKARALMTNESDDRLHLVSCSNPGAATFALFAKLRKRDFRRLHPQV